MGDVLLPVGPRTPLQVTAPEGVVEQLTLIQPGGVGQGQPGSPPTVAPGEVSRRFPSDVAGPAVVHQEDSPEPAMLTSEPIQRRDVMGGVVLLQAGRHHLAAVDHQQGQDADRAVPGCTRTPAARSSGQYPADRAAFEHLAVGHLVAADDQDLLLG
jgi:hypothetical protein